MTIQELHSDIRLMLPESDGRYFSPEDIDSFIHMAVTDLFNAEYKVFEESQRITELMSFFHSVSARPIAAGVGTVPADLFYITNLFCSKIGAVAVERDVDLITQQFSNSSFHSEAFGPDENHIFVQRINTGLKVRPLSVTEVTVAYLRKPNKAKFGYNTSLDGFSFVYDLSKSVQIDFPEQGHVEVMNKTLRYMGVPLRQSALVQTEAIAKAGNQPEIR